MNFQGIVKVVEASGAFGPRPEGVTLPPFLIQSELESGGR
jgi:hypothetical protein